MELKKAGIESNRIQDNAREGQSEREEKSRLRKLAENLLDSAKKTTHVLAFAVGMTVLAYNCGGKIESTGDADNIEMVDGENDAVDAPDVDVPDAEVEDMVEDDGAETGCIGPGSPLEGDVDPLLANTEEGGVELNDSDSEISGDYEMIIGGEVSGDITILGECPEDPDSIAAFGAQDGTVNVTPEYRLDFGTTVFTAEMPDVDGADCPPLEVDEDIVSMYNDEVNLAVKKTTVGAVNTRGEFGFTTTFEPSILVNGLEADSTIPLNGYGYDVKAIMLSIDSPLLEMGAKVYSKAGEEVLSREVEGSVDSVNSKKLRVYQLGPDDSMIPDIEWEDPPVNPYTGTVIKCTRPCDDPDVTTENSEDISAVVIPVVVDSCGRILDGFDIDPSTLNIALDESAGGFHGDSTLRPYYSFNISVISGSFETMGDGNLIIRATVIRTPVLPPIDMGGNIQIHLLITGEYVSRDIDLESDEQERSSFSKRLMIEEPDVANYTVFCECPMPAGF